MSAGNGQSDDWNERLISLVDRGVGAISQRYPATAQLSARERSEQMDALIAQLESLTREHNALVKAVDGLLKRAKATEVDIDCLSGFDRDQEQRIIAIERGAAILSAWARRSFWERVRGRLGL